MDFETVLAPSDQMDVTRTISPTSAPNGFKRSRRVRESSLSNDTSARRAVRRSRRSAFRLHIGTACARWAHRSRVHSVQSAATNNPPRPSPSTARASSRSCWPDCTSAYTRDGSFTWTATGSRHLERLSRAPAITIPAARLTTTIGPRWRDYRDALRAVRREPVRHAANLQSCVSPPASKHGRDLYLRPPLPAREPNTRLRRWSLPHQPGHVETESNVNFVEESRQQ